MDCNGSQRIVRQLHDASEIKKVGEAHMELSLEHLGVCKKCQSWFSQNMCPKMQNEMGEDARMMHGTLHAEWSECPHL